MANWWVSNNLSLVSAYMDNPHANQKFIKLSDYSTIYFRKKYEKNIKINFGIWKEHSKLITNHNLWTLPRFRITINDDISLFAALALLLAVN